MGNDNPVMPTEIESRHTTTFIDAANLVAMFEADLKSLGIRVAEGSELELVSLYIMDLELRRRRESPIDEMEDIRPMWRRAVSLIETLKMLHVAREQGKLKIFEPHLRLLNSSTVAQNVRAFSDDGCNKLFEMLIGLICLPIGTDVSLDDPVNSKGNNPDVMVDFDGVQWGFSCKVLNGNSPLTMFERLEDGVDQIERSSVQQGVVVFNMRNLVDHDLVWPILNEEAYRRREETPTFRGWSNSAPVEAYLKSLSDMKHAEFVDQNGQAPIDALFRGKKALPACLNFFQTTTSVRRVEGPAVTTIGVFGVMTFGNVTQDQMRVLQRMNASLHGMI